MHRLTWLNQIVSGISKAASSPSRHPVVDRSSLVISAALVAGLLFSANGFAQLPAPVAFYSLNGTTNDSSVNTFNGTVNGANTYATGILGQQAFLFNGSTNITLGNGADTTTLGIYNGSFTVNQWANFTNPTNGNGVTLVGTQNNANNNALQLILRNDTPYMGFFGNDSNGNVAIASNTWYNIAYVYDATAQTQSVYVNGVLDYTSGGHAPYAGQAQTTFIGGSCCGNDPDTGSLMQDVGIYDTAFNQSQISAFYNTTSFVAPQITWTGTAGTGTYAGLPPGTTGVWDSTTGALPAPTANWTGTPQTYAEGDLVTFDNTGINTNIAIQPGGVAPGSVTFNNSTTPYSFTNSIGDTNGITGPAIVTLTANAGSVTFNSPNTYSGPTIINGGSLRINNANSLQNSTATVNVNGGLIFGAGVGTFNLGALAGTGNIAMTDTSPAPVNLVVGSSGNSGVYNGSLSGGGNFTKAGSGVQTLGGVNTYAGNTVITGGTLRLNPVSLPSIGVHFGGDQQGGNDMLAATTSAGVSPASVAGVNFAMTHWNNTSGSNGSASNIMNNSGGASGASVSWLSNGTQNGGTFSTGDNQLMATFLNTNSTNTVTFTNIPYSSYEVVSYVGAEGANGRLASVTAVGSTDAAPSTTYYFQTSNNTGSNPYQYAQLTNTTPGTYPAANYAVSTGLSGSTLTVSESNYSSYSGIMGIEILNTSVGSLPSSTAVSISGGAFLDLFGSYQSVASLTGTGTVTNNGPMIGTLALAPASGSTTFSGTIQDGTSKSALTMSGPGTQILASANTFSGPTNVNGGVLQLNHANALQNSTVTVNVNGSPIGPSGLVFGSTIGTFNFGALAGNSNLTLADTASQPVNLVVGGNGASGTYGGTLNGAGSLTKAGSGVQILTGVNSYLGSTSITGGTLRVSPSSAATQIAAGNAIGIHFGADTDNPNYVLAAASVAGVPGFAMSNWNNAYGNNGSTTNLNTSVSSTGVVMNGAGAATGVTVSWSSQNGTFSNNDNHSDPNDQLMGSFLNDGPGNGHGNSITISNIPYTSYEVLAYVGSEDTANQRESNLNIGNSPTMYFGTDTADGQYPGAFSQITNTTNGNYPQGNYAVVTGLSGSSITISDGAIAGQSNTGLPAIEIINTTLANTLPSTAVNIATGSTLDLNNSIQQVASLNDFTSGSQGTVTNSGPGAASLILVPTTGSATFSGVIQNGNGNVSLTLNGNGTQVLAGTNTYTGPTTVLNGTLRVTGSLAAGSAVSVGGNGANGLPRLSGTGTIFGPVTINGPGTGVVGTILATGGSTLSLAGGLTFQDGSFANLNLGSPNGTANPANALLATSGPINSLTANGTDTISFSNPSPGVYDLISYTGSTASSNFVLDSNSIANYAGLTFQLLNGSGQIDLLVSTPPIIWSGVTVDGSGNAPWDYSTQNWVTADGTPTTYADPNGVVTFGDFYPNGQTVVNSTCLHPSWRRAALGRDAQRQRCRQRRRRLHVHRFRRRQRNRRRGQHHLERRPNRQRNRDVPEPQQLHRRRLDQRRLSQYRK